MSDSPVPVDKPDKGRHYELISSAVDDAFKTATISRGLALAATPLSVEPWYTTAPAAYLEKLKVANIKAWVSQNQVDHLLEKIDLQAFAIPLLQTKIKERHGIDVDVKNTWLRLYMPKSTPWYALNISEGAKARDVSLLDAALHNFASGERVAAGSDFISKPDQLGNFDIQPIKHTMSVNQFQALCRELNLGAQYKKHLESYLLPGEPLAESVLKHKVIDSQKDALAVAAHLALIKNDIEYDAYKMLLDMAGNQTRLMLNGRRMQCCDLSMLGTRLTGVLLLMAAVRDNRGINRLIVYIPHDPDHPLKEYPSPQAFSAELARQLREDNVSVSTKQSYRQFFSQFIDHQQRGHFFADLEQRLFITRYHKPTDATDQRPAWRKDPVPDPRLRLEHLPLAPDYWTHAYQQKLNKTLNDAREIAVSTADADSNARWAWWDNFKKIVSDIFNAALFVATPFVPGLGQVMLVYTAYQITTDVVEGLVDLAEGLWQEVGEHVTSVVSSLIQLAAFGIGSKIGDTFKLKLSKLIEGMKPVKLPDGKPALWFPDIAPYEQKKLTLPAASKPDRQGLHQVGSANILPLQGKLYSVEKASTQPTSRTHRIKHPSRPNAYRPKIEHNDHGAWRHEAESPQDWSDQTLMQRLGHDVERFSPAELEQIRISSGTDTDELRQMHDDNSPPPPLLADTIKRFTAYDDVQRSATLIRDGQPLASDAVWFEPITTGLPGWPRERALRVYEQADLSGYSRKYGNPGATDANTLNISHTDLIYGKLPERLAGFLDDAECKALLGRDVAPAERPQALRERLADAVQARQGEVAKRLYQAGERSNKADIRVVQQTFPEMPLTLAEKLLTGAKPAEMQRIVDENRLPLRIKAQARELNFEASAARAYEGFYRDESVLPDTERLALNTLKIHTDTFADLRIEVLDGVHDGPLRCSAGADDATQVRRLIRNEHGQYEVVDGNNRPLHDASDFYQAMLNALPDGKRVELGSKGTDGRRLKAWIMEATAAPGERRTLLAEPPIRTVPTIETETLVRGWPWFFGEKTPEKRIKQLYPKMNDREVTTFIQALQNKGDIAPAIEQLENERIALRQTLSSWRESYSGELDDFGDRIPGVSRDFLQNGGRHIEEQLLECFERKSDIFGERSNHPEQGYTLDLSTDLSQPDLDRWWNDLRQQPGMTKYLNQITALKLDNTHFSVADKGLLDDFAHLRQLSARQCDLTEISPALGRMRQLETLDLADNNITVMANSNKQLSRLSRLQTLILSGNPLRRPPAVGRLYRLNRLDLANSTIETWPEGLFKVGNADRHRSRGFALDMRQCPISSLPEVTPGSDQAFILSRARFDTARLSNGDRIRYGDYRQSVGFSRQQVYSPAVADEINHWRLLPQEQGTFSPSTSFTKYREESWQDVLAEPGSEGLFKVIRKQRDARDYQSDKSRRQLTQRVWEMIDAAALDSELREELFKHAREPDNCREGGAQLFNYMGMKVLVSKAYAQPTSAKVLDIDLTRLARNAARLDRIADVAVEEVKRQEQQHLINPGRNAAPDEIEVHMAYETGLGKRLELPWQSEGMLYQPRSGVTQVKIDAAYDSIIAREQGDGLVDGMIDSYSDPFWERHLRRTHPTQYEINDRLFEEKPGLLDELRKAQAEWANPTPQTQMNRLQRKMEGLANQLNIPHREVFSGDPMSDARYDRWMKDIGYARNQLSRTLTHQALARAGL
ncbi:dermonecrotic toxin domain-containing protein [Pseudomonas sp. NPDC087639]|uniref:dermonecrotic toxin domain-containing protein n=1 Tax=Pseudomonas sp. NPDC087639 TaxID=3364445 RepID=UPI00380491A1